MLHLGNHALALCMAARTLEPKHGSKIPVTVVISRHINPAKLVELKSTSATIVMASHSNSTAIIEETLRISQSTGASYIPPADHPDIVLGQATCIAEFLEQLQEMGVPQLDAVIIPSGGGGLLTGAALYCKGHNIGVFGAEPVHGGPRLRESLRRGMRLELESHVSTIADGLRTSTGRLNWQLLKSKDFISGVLAAQEDQIIHMHHLLLTSTGMSIEPSAAVGIAAVASSENLEHISKSYTKPIIRLGFVVTGGNACL